MDVTVQTEIRNKLLQRRVKDEEFTQEEEENAKMAVNAEKKGANA